MNKLQKIWLAGCLQRIAALLKDERITYLKGYEDLSASEIKELIDLCASKAANFVEQRGNQIWSHRRNSSGYIPGTIRYEVLKRAKSRCELCGISNEDKAIEVDHIVPRNQGGTDDLSNLQALCYSCNAMKRDRDDTDFRGIAQSYQQRQSGCVFCEIDKGEVLAENELCYAKDDLYPVTKNHALIVPKRHVPEFFDLHQPEINAIHALLSERQKAIEGLDKTVSGFNVGVNSGEENKTIKLNK